MTRTLSVAGSLAILMFALWIVQAAKVSTHVSGAGVPATDVAALAATAAADLSTTAVDDLAGWPIAAGR